MNGYLSQAGTAEAASVRASCMLIYNLHNIQRQRHSPGPDPGGRGKQSFTWRQTAVRTTLVDFLFGHLKSLRERHTFDTLRTGMPIRLDYRLRQVAALRQVSIKSARDWRDSENHKWEEALAEIEKREAAEREKSRRQNAKRNRVTNGEPDV